MACHGKSLDSVLAQSRPQSNKKKTQQKFTIWELVRKSKMTSQIHGWNYSQKVTFWAELKMKGGKTQGLDK